MNITKRIGLTDIENKPVVIREEREGGGKYRGTEVNTGVQKRYKLSGIK